MNKKYFVLTAVCAAALIVTACGGGDAAPVAATATTPINLAPVPTGTAPAAATPTTSVTAPTTTAPAPAAPVTTAPVTTAPVTTAPAGMAPAAATPTTSVTVPTAGVPTTTPATPVPTTPAAIVTSLTGSVVKGPVGNATVTAKKPDGTACGTTATNATGQYAFTTSCTGDVIIEVTGGSYLDEATNVTKVLDTPLKSMISATGGTVNGVVTPLTSMAFSYAFTSSNAATKAAFDAQAVKIATQFGLVGVNLGTTLPVVAGTTNAYGNALKGISQYLKDNPTQTLAAVTTASFKSALEVSSFSSIYTNAFNKINGTNITLTFDGGAFNFSGTGAGGGSGTCGISQVGTITAGGFTVPINIDYCVSGLIGSCDSGNSTLNQSLSGQSVAVGGANITTTYSSVCKAGAQSIVIK